MITGPARFLLAPAGAAWMAAASLRNALYDTGLLRTHACGLPVLSVGNPTWGGTGKTPFVSWILQRARAGGFHPILLTRGYGGAPVTEPAWVSGPDLPVPDWRLAGDETAMLARIHPALRAVRSANRVAGARLAASGAPSHAFLVLDDGGQHRALQRDVDVMLLPADPCETRWPPFGRLREPLRQAVSRATHLVAPGHSAPLWAQRLGRTVAALRTGPVRLVAPPDADGPAPDTFTLVTGIAGPGRVLETARALDLDIPCHVAFPDHHPFRAEEILAAGPGPWLTTAKDAVRWPPGIPSPYTLAYEVAGDDELWNRLLGGMRFVS